MSEERDLGLREALEAILHCTPHVRDGAIIFDCGDPFEIARAALKSAPSVPPDSEGTGT